MKILITVIVPNQSRLRSDISNWDTYGAAQALDDEMTLFDPSVFEKPGTGMIAQSTKVGYSWQVKLSPNFSNYPIIQFFDVHQNKLVATMTGTPKERGEVATIIKNLTGIKSTASTSKVITAGFGWLALALFLIKIKQVKN